MVGKGGIELEDGKEMSNGIFFSLFPQKPI